MARRHDVRKSDGRRAVVHISSGASVGTHSQGKSQFRVEEFGGEIAPPRCSVCKSRDVAVIRADKDDICANCLLSLSHGLNEAEKTMGERGKRYDKPKG